MTKPLVVGVDGSESSLQAVDWAAVQAGRHGLPLRIVYGSKWEHYEGLRPSVGSERPAERVWTENMLAGAENRARKIDPELTIHPVIEAGDPVDVLLSQAHEAAQMVVGPRGHGPIAGMLLGSVSLAVASRAVCPVTVVRGRRSNRRGEFASVVVGLGDSLGAAGTLRYAFEEARAAKSGLRVVRCWRTPVREALEHAQPADGPHLLHRREAEERLEDVLGAVENAYADVPVGRDVEQGSAHQVLVELSAHADLLVVGARRHSEGHGLQIGRVGHAALHHASCPVAVVPESR